MNVDRILQTLNEHGVQYLLVGGMNFALNHVPVVTLDVDLWIEDSAENRKHCEVALAELQAEWGPTEAEWQPVAQRQPGWLDTQGVFCLTSPHGAIDVFRSVKGLSSWADARANARPSGTASGVPFLGLSDEDMLRCQMALPESQRNPQRIETLKRALGEADHE